MNVPLEGIVASPTSANSMASAADSGQVAYQLVVTQQPDYTRVATSKEKDRKPVDPPPIVQLKVSAAKDPNQIYLQNPYYFMMVGLVKGNDKDEKEPSATALLGTLVSSIHRLKDLDNTDGGFFIFGDLSVKVEGTFRLQFTLYELKDMECVLLATKTSNPFQVYGTKNFPGMCQSTVITRNFSDQGVRLRLRKDSRQMSSKRRNDDSVRMTSQYRSQQRDQERAQLIRRTSLNTDVSASRSQSLQDPLSGISPASSRGRNPFSGQPSPYYDATTGYPSSTGSPYGQQYNAGSVDYGMRGKRPRISQSQDRGAYQSVTYRQLTDASSAMTMPSLTSGQHAYATTTNQILGGITYPPHSMASSLSTLGYPHRTLPPLQATQPSMSAMVQTTMPGHIHASPVGNPTHQQLWSAHDLYRPDPSHPDHGYD
jgi:hypothetical protein